MSGHLALWDAVCTTDPAHTKRVAQRGGFTSIDAYYTIKRLTEQFGPLGTGWGWAADFSFEEGAVVCMARFWYQLDGKRSDPTPILTMNKLSDGRGIDEDAGKKALTDAITKWASYLGFSADVFEGKFDDNKYVQSLEAEKRQSKTTEPPATGDYDPPVIDLHHDQNGIPLIEDFANEIIAALEAPASLSESRKLWAANKKGLKQVEDLSASVHKRIYDAFAARNKAFQ